MLSSTASGACTRVHPARSFLDKARTAADACRAKGRPRRKEARKSESIARPAGFRGDTDVPPRRKKKWSSAGRWPAADACCGVYTCVGYVLPRGREGGRELPPCAAAHALAIACARDPAHAPRGRGFPRLSAGIAISVKVWMDCVAENKISLSQPVITVSTEEKKKRKKKQ